MEVNVPAWLNNSFLETALKSVDDPNMEVVIINVVHATSSGDNYVGDVYRVTLNVSHKDLTEQKSVIVKAAKQTNNEFKAKSDGIMYDRETAMYKTISEMYNLISTKSPETHQPFSAKLLYSTVTDQILSIVMEDLSAHNFRLADRRKRLNFKHCLLAMKKLGQFHGTSFALQKKNPDLFLKFMNNAFGNDKAETYLNNLFGPFVRNIAKEVKNWSEYEERISENLLRLGNNFYKEYKKSLERDDTEFNVLCHGDLWVNNMMFRYLEEEPVDIRFIDFQFVYWTSPAVDLQYFLHTSVSLDYQDKWDILIAEYHRSLGETLTLLGYQDRQPTLQELHRQMERRSLFAVLVSTSFLPIILSDKNTVPDFLKLASGEQEARISETYKMTLRKFLPKFQEHGWL